MSADILTRDGDAIRCACGNQPHLDGFYVSDIDGTTREGEYGPESGWDGTTMTCYSCGRTFNIETLEIVGFTSDAMLAGARLVI